GGFVGRYIYSSFEKVNNWYIGYVEELPGANTQGRTLDEVRSNLKEAISLILKSNKELIERELTGKKVVREDIKVEF
ncbi:unnamed protein product, partial [marine sediment metagenome]